MQRNANLLPPDHTNQPLSIHPYPIFSNKKRTFIPSLNPTSAAKAASISTVGTSASCLPPALAAASPPPPSLPRIVAIFVCDCSPVQPRKTDFGILDVADLFLGSCGVEAGGAATR